MTEQPPEHLTENEEDEPAAADMPRWIPVTIASVLVALAALAVYTGMRYRDTTLVDIVKAKRPGGRPAAVAPEGEPGAGASLVIGSPGGDVVPAAGEPVTGESRAVVTGGPGGVEAVVRMWARRGVMFAVDPDSADIYVNDVPIGTAKQFDTQDEIYDFAEPGSYTIRVEAPGRQSRTFVVTSSEDANDDVAMIRTKLPPAK